MSEPIRARVYYTEFAGQSRLPLALRMRMRFEEMGIRFRRPESMFDFDEPPEPLPPYRMIQSCDGRWLEIEQGDETDPAQDSRLAAG